MPDPSSNGADRINCYALVAYIPGPLGHFLDQLRCELEPNSLAPRAHITILPPRGLSPGVSNDQAWAELYQKLVHLGSFQIEIGDVETFIETNVVYFSVVQGWDRLLELHTALANGSLSFHEPFPYHPHVTVAQRLTADQARAIRESAQRRWKAYDGPRGFSVETVSFVQNSTTDLWYDLAEMTLPQAVPSR